MDEGSLEKNGLNFLPIQRDGNSELQSSWLKAKKEIWHFQLISFMAVVFFFFVMSNLWNKYNYKIWYEFSDVSTNLHFIIYKAWKNIKSGIYIYYIYTNIHTNTHTHTYIYITLFIHHLVHRHDDFLPEGNNSIAPLGSEVHRLGLSLYTMRMEIILIVTCLIIHNTEIVVSFKNS